MQTLTDAFKNAMPSRAKKDPDSAIARQITTNPLDRTALIPREPAQFASRKNQMEDEIPTTETKTGVDPTAKTRTLTNRMTTETTPNDPGNIVNETIKPRTNVKFVSGVEILDTSAMNAEAKRRTI